MTRINAGVHPSELCDKHLLAEHREIKRMPNMVKSGRAKLSSIPERFTLGPGHVKFFYDKLGYLRCRYREIYKECIRRNFNVTNFESSFAGIPEHLFNNWEPSGRDREIILARIEERLHH